MTQKYYTERLLSGLCEDVQKVKEKHGRAILQKDNDPSHDTITDHNLAA